MNYIEAIRVANEESKYEILVNGNLNVENAAIIYKNFAGAPTRVNPAGGKYTFALCLNEEYAARLFNMGWNIKAKEVRPRSDDDDSRTMTVNFDQWDMQYRNEFENTLFYTEIVCNKSGEYPPKIYKVSEFDGQKSMMIIPPERWDRLDSTPLENIDVSIRPYQHGRNALNPEAKKGYLKTMYAMAVPVNDFGGKYAEYTITGED